jgi:hypothetical protein
VLLALAGPFAVPAGPLKWIALAGEAAFFLLAFCDRFLPKGFPLKRLSSPARTFTAMNLASMMGLAVFFVEPTTLWRPTRVK